MAASNETRIVLTAEDKTAPALASVTRGLQGMQGHADMAQRALGALGVTLSAAAAVSFVKGTIDAADGMNDLSQKVGIGIRQLAGWRLAAEQSGTTMDSVAKGVKGLSAYIVEHGDKLRAAGVTATDANGAMMQLADIFAYMPDGVEKTALAVQLFGKAGMDMIPMLNMGSKGLVESQEKARAYAEELEKLAPRADKFNDTLRELKLQSEASALTIADKLIDPMQQLAEFMQLARGAAEGMVEAMRKLDTMTGNSPTSVFKVGEILAQMGISRSRGYGGPVNAQGLPATAGEQFDAATEAFVAEGGIDAAYKRQAAAKRARALLGGSGASGQKYQRGFDPQGDLEAAIFQRDFEDSKKRAIANDKYFEDLEKKRLAMEEMAEKRMEQQRIESEGEEAIRMHMEKTNREIKKQDDLARDLGLTFSSAFEDAIIGGKGLQSVLRGLAQDVARIFLRKTVTEPMVKSLSGLFKGGIGSVVDRWFGGSAAASVSNGMGFGAAGDAGALLGFAGGGFTGNGARSGGMDGQGGFLAMLHPQETVIDHAQGGGGGSAVTVILNISTGVAQTVRAEISNLLPSISASVQGAVMDARLRGGATRAAYRG